MRALETSKEDLEEELRQHKDVATKSSEYYKASTDKCRLQWSDIAQLTSKSVLSRSEREELERKRSTALCSPLVPTTSSQSQSHRGERQSSQGLPTISRRCPTTFLALSIILRGSRLCMCLMNTLDRRTLTTQFLSSPTTGASCHSSSHGSVSGQSSMTMPPVRIRIGFFSHGQWRL